MYIYHSDALREVVMTWCFGGRDAKITRALIFAILSFLHFWVHKSLSSLQFTHVLAIKDSPPFKHLSSLPRPRAAYITMLSSSFVILPCRSLFTSPSFSIVASQPPTARRHQTKGNKPFTYPVFISGQSFSHANPMRTSIGLKAIYPLTKHIASAISRKSINELDLLNLKESRTTI